MQSLAFPMRLQENGLLLRQDSVASIMALLQIMVRTPAGSWPGCPSFGLRDLLEGGRTRADIPQLAMRRLNDVLADLGITGYVVAEVIRELSAQRDVDTYAITIRSTSADERFTTVVAYEP